MKQRDVAKPETVEKPYEGMNAVLYARVSTDDKGQTTESQVREMKRWCEFQGVNILNIYEEEKSAKDLERPEFDRLLGRIARGKGDVNMLLAWSESRISRNTADMMQIKELVGSYHTIIRYVSSSAKPELDDGELTNYVNTWQAQREREDLSKNTKNGMITADAKGIHCGRPLTFAFAHTLSDPEIKKKIKWGGKQKTKVATIESVMDYAKEGYSLEATAARLGTNRRTLSTALSEEGRLEEFKQLYSQNSNSIFAKKTRAQGGTGARVNCLNTNDEKKESA